MSLNCTVISLVPTRIVEEKPGLYPPRFIIEESNGDIPQILHVGNAMHRVYLDESRGWLQVNDPSDVVAKAIVNDFISSQLAVSDEVGPALWWVDSQIDTADIMKLQRAEYMEKKFRQRKWFVNLIKMADDDWARYHKHVVISDFQRKIGHIMDINPEDHEWMTPLALQQGKTLACPFCMTSIPTGAVICSECGQIIDHKRKAEIEKELQDGRSSDS